VLIATLKHKDYEVVDVAANCLGLLGPRAKDAVPALAVAVTRDFNKVFYTGDPQVSAATALRRIGPQARSAIPSLIGALKYRHVVRSGPIGGGEENRDCSAAAAAAQVLGFFRAEAKAAIPALIEAVQAREKDDANWFVRQSAALALAHIGPDAKVAVPALRNVIKENGVNIQNLPEALIALYRLAPDGKALAERWLEQRAIVRVGRAREMEFALEGRAMVLGAMGRTSVESDWLTRRWLESMDAMIAFGHPIDGDPADDQESWFEKIGRFGVAGRLAIPRLNEFRKYPNPWVRMWAAEALERIVPHPPVKAE